MTPKDALRNLLAFVLPWPVRHQRKAAIAQARAARDAARRKALHAAKIRSDITRIVADNHFAQRTHDAFRGYPEAR